LTDQDRQQGEGSKWQWGPANPQALNRYSYVLDNPLRYTDPTGHFIPLAVAALFTAEVILEVAALFVVYSFVSAVITCSQDPGCSSVLGRFADQLNQGVITVQQFLGGIQRSLAQGTPPPGFTQHGWDQASGREGVGVNDAAIEDARNNPISVKQQADGKEMRIGKDAVIVVSAQGDIITTCFRKGL